MIIRKINSGILLLCFFVINGYSQDELKKIIPLSPTAAAITRYGEVPVSYFTGVPDINIPLYTISAQDMTLPIGLNYHAGGNKVEAIASWVGLGWSLNTVPVISRTVRGLPDEGAGGFFAEFDSHKFKDIYDNRFGTTPEQNRWNNFMSSVRDGVQDSEPDIFFYLLAGKSGKFFYDQQTEKFLTYPRENIKIVYDGGFTITDDNGVNYHFTTTEVLGATTGSGTTYTTTSWNVEKMVNANRTDSIVFTYDTETQLFNNTTSVTKYVKYGTNNDCLGAPQLDYEEQKSSNSNSAKRLFSISFRNGSITFQAKSMQREDLEGGYALDSIIIKNSEQLPVKKYNLLYHYVSSTGGGHGCTGVNASETKWMFLDTLYETSFNNGRSNYSFSYNTSNIPPCRTSPAQDFWGYYNGKTSNVNLIPTTNLHAPGITNPIHIEGANRFVDTNYSRFGIIKKITYPTGGNTEYEFENNWVADTTVPATNYKGQSAIIEAGGTEPPPVNYYSETFVINNPPDPILNGDNVNGGAFVSIDAGEFGCNLMGGSGTCANINIHKTSGGGAGFFMSINANTAGNTHHSVANYLPNGTYLMEASFSQDPPLWGNFFMIATWSSIDTVITPFNRLAGGLRVRKIKNYDGVSHANDVVKKYRYTLNNETDSTSGGIMGTQFFNYVDDITQEYLWPDINQGTHHCLDHYMRIKSYSNIQAVSQSGSFVGYSTVITEYNEQNTEGITVRNFLNIPDIVLDYFPYPPTESYEHLRGMPTFITEYKKSGSNYIPVSRTNYGYQDLAGTNTGWGLKTANQIMYKTAGGITGQPPVPDYEAYNVLSTLTGMIHKTERTYDQNDATRYNEIVTNYEYSPIHFQLTNSTTQTSKGEEIETINYYPGDLSLSSTAETARLALITQNRVATVLKQETLNEGIQMNETKTNYKVFNTGVVMPEEMFHKIGSGSSESRIKFLRYDANGNIISQQKTNDAVVSYIWDYTSNYPIAECTNADSASIAYTSFEADGKGGWTFSGSTSGTYSVTGAKSYLASGGNITRSSLTSATYIVSYWGRNGSVDVNSAGPTRTGKTIGDWTYYEHEVTTTSITVSGSNYIDELRLYPKNALMTTYTYTPLVGMTSQCDANNKIIYYEYDSFGRLKLIRDEEGRILKRMDYKYQATSQQ